MSEINRVTDRSPEGRPGKIEQRYARFRMWHYAGGYIPIPMVGRGCVLSMSTFTGKFRGHWNERDPADPGPWRGVNNWTFGRAGGRVGEQEKRGRG